PAPSRNANERGRPDGPNPPAHHTTHLMTAALIATAGTFGTDLRGPGHPFGTPWLAFVDTVRVLLILALGWNVTLAGRAVLAHTVHAARGIALAAFCWVVGITEWDKLGLGVGHGGRLWLSVIAFAAVTTVTWPWRHTRRGRP
nr:hypothetical protein [Actinomycetota bacterium]